MFCNKSNISYASFFYITSVLFLAQNVSMNVHLFYRPLYVYIYHDLWSAIKLRNGKGPAAFASIVETANGPEAMVQQWKYRHGNILSSNAPSKWKPKVKPATAKCFLLYDVFIAQEISQVVI